MEFHVFVSSKFVIKAWILEHYSKRAPHSVLVCNWVVAVHEHCPGRGAKKRGKHLYCGCFSRTVRSKAWESLTTFYREGNIIYCCKVAELFREIPDLYCVIIWFFFLGHINLIDVR